MIAFCRVYSLGIHEVMQEAAHHCRHSSSIIGAIWKTYAILLEDFNSEEYVMALTQRKEIFSM